MSFVTFFQSFHRLFLLAHSDKSCRKKERSHKALFAGASHFIHKLTSLLHLPQPAVNKGSDRKKEGIAPRLGETLLRVLQGLLVHPFLNVAHGHVQVSARITGIQVENNAAFRNGAVVLPTANRGDCCGIVGRDGEWVQVRGALCLRDGLRSSTHGS